jgi:hypothetical protein
VGQLSPDVINDAVAAQRRRDTARVLDAAGRPFVPNVHEQVLYNFFGGFPLLELAVRKPEDAGPIPFINLLERLFCHPAQSVHQAGILALGVKTGIRYKQSLATRLGGIVLLN